MAQAVDRRKAEKKDELVDKLVYINRVAKTVKGGRNMSFAAVVVVGDQKGRVGYGSGKATEVPDAIVKATNEAKKNMVRIPLREGRTLHHDVNGRFGAGKVVLRTAPAGTGVIAGGPMRAIFEVLGILKTFFLKVLSGLQGRALREKVDCGALPCRKKERRTLCFWQLTWETAIYVLRHLMMFQPSLSRNSKSHRIYPKQPMNMLSPFRNYSYIRELTQKWLTEL